MRRQAVWIRHKTEEAALMFLYKAITGHLDRQNGREIPAEISNQSRRSVDVEFPNFTEQLLAEIKTWPEVEDAGEIKEERDFPDPESIRDTLLHELRERLPRSSSIAAA